jgi:hypothetical protein
MVRTPDMKRLLFYLVGIVLSLLSLWGAVLLTFINPLNWKITRTTGGGIT